MHLTIAAEGSCDLAMMRRMVDSAGHQVDREFNCRGKGNLDKRLPGYINACAHYNWFVLRDLDRDHACAPGLLGMLAPQGIPDRMLFRIAVRSMESWLLADRDAISGWLRVPKRQVDSSPEDLQDPKGYLASLASRSSSKELRQRMSPDDRSGARVGPEYESSITEFISQHWKPTRAADGGLSPSLSRAMAALASLP